LRHEWLKLAERRQSEARDVDDIGTARCMGGEAGGVVLAEFENDKLSAILESLGR
jgi:hypothetical protein